MILAAPLHHAMLQSDLQREQRRIFALAIGEVDTLTLKTRAQVYWIAFLGLSI
jgi:hypothetical protein